VCGIIGIYTRKRENLEARAEAALETVKDRGPDSRRILFSGFEGSNGHFGALGAARLAMVDVDGPNQPLETADRRYRIACNGEVWNYRELRREMESRGVVFATAGDTEAVLYVVAANGLDAPQRFRGQFAYIVEDTRDGLIHAGRDPHGICPLYYGKNRDEDLILASALKVLLDNGVAGQDVRLLPQGHTFVYDTASGKFRFHRYYDIMERIRPGLEVPPIRDLKERLFRIIEERIPREVPYAAIVGGIDSSLATAVCCKADLPPLCVITVTTTDDENCSDVRNARLLSEMLGVESRVSVVDEDYIRKNLQHVINILGSANYFEVVTGILGLKAAEMTKEAGGKAIVTGGGSDEIFGGYDFAWSLFQLDRLEPNLLHIYRQTGVFECHREDSVSASVGVEARPAYYDTELAEILFSIPLEKRILGLGTGDVTEKAILKQIARGVLPDSIVDARKSPFYRSTSILTLFEKVADKLITREEAAAWKKKMVKRNPSLAGSMLMPGKGPVLIHKTFTGLFPGLEDLTVPGGPPDYDDPQSYGRFYCFFGSPFLEGFKWPPPGDIRW
jgi:asparagine synthase (glutamine-hydrolysing)